MKNDIGVKKGKLEKLFLVLENLLKEERIERKRKESFRNVIEF